MEQGRPSCLKTSSLIAVERLFVLFVRVFFPLVSVLFVCLSLNAVVTAAPVAQLKFPGKPVRWIVPVPAGGSLDILARIVAQKLAERWSSQIVIDNRPGAGNRLGTEIAANATADGYTQALLASPTLTSDRALHGKAYDPVKAFAPITVVAATSQLLVVNPELPAKTVVELIAYARSRPGQLNYGSTGVGGSLHLAMELFKSMTGVDIVHVPYKGGPLAVIDLLNGQLALMFFNAPAALPYVKSGKLRALGISAAQRSPLLPDVPAISEAGVRDFKTEIWFGLLVPAGTAPEIVRKMHMDVIAVLATPDIRKQLIGLGLDPIGSTSEEFASRIKTETAMWTRVMKAARISMD